MKLAIRAIVLKADFSEEFGNSDVTFHDLETKQPVRVSLKGIDFRAPDEMSYLIPRDYVLDGVQIFNGVSKAGKSYSQMSATGIHNTEIAAPAAPRPNGSGAAKPEKVQA